MEELLILTLISKPALTAGLLSAVSNLIPLSLSLFLLLCTPNLGIPGELLRLCVTLLEKML